MASFFSLLATGRIRMTRRPAASGTSRTGTRHLLCAVARLLAAAPGGVNAADPASPASAPAAFPRFIVPGHEDDCALLEDLFRRHFGSRTGCALWFGWLPMATLWPAVGAEASASADAMRGHYRAAFLGHRIDGEGYVSMQQHRGLAHSEGWPFPTWPQAGGAGWHFSLADDVYAIQLGVQPTSRSDDWSISGIEPGAIDPQRGWDLRISAPLATLEVPSRPFPSLVAPFIRIEWQTTGLPPEARCFVEWTTSEEQGFPQTSERRFEVALNPDDGNRPMHFLNIPVHRHPQWTGTIARTRLRFENAAGATITLKSLITAIDTRHPITNTNYIQGCTDYFNWTGDTGFLRENIDRMRIALGFAMREFRTEDAGCVRVPWVGHDGRPGFHVGADGWKSVHHGTGVGNNYWDLLPFGADDALATLYFLDAVQRMADLEEWMARQEEPLGGTDSATPPGHGPAPFDPSTLRAHAESVRDRASRRFWNPATGRFVACIDRDGTARDYGFTFLNLEAIHFGLAGADQARLILDWIDGARSVAGDTSTGADIYHWRFAPRATTRRNVEWYAWVWHNPESIPWGGQVQDGGAVLGFSYHDLMARLAVNGPDDAWNRLRAILDWYREVQAEGGYRAYYAKPGRGSLQGGGTPGGLGIDHEFFESVLVPQAMLHGFLGFVPTPGGCRVAPRLPAAWPSLTVTHVHFRDHVIDIEATNREIRITPRRAGRSPVTVAVPAGWSGSGPDSFTWVPDAAQTDGAK